MRFRVVSAALLLAVGIGLVASVLGASVGWVSDSPRTAEAPPASSFPGLNPAATPTLTANPVSGPVGTQITFTGSGFAKKSAVSVTWAEGEACSSTTNSSGGFSCSYQMTQYTPGPETFTATDASDNSASTTFTVVSQLAVSPTSGPAGTSVTFTGTGFQAGTAWYVTWQSGLVNACEAITNGYGSFSCAYTIPPGTATGSYTFTSTDPTEHTATATFDVTYTPTLKASPDSGAIGTTISFTGASFASSSPVTVSWPEGTACTSTTNASGGFTCTFQITQFTPGGVAFAATDEDSGTGDALFTVVPQLTVSPTSGPAGTSVTFTGTGFQAGTAWYVTWQSGLVNACEAITNGYGSFSCAYTIPAGTPKGSHTFTSTDPTEHTATATFDVTYTPTLTASPNASVIGTVITFTGSGFAKKSAVTVSWPEGTACTSTTNASGGFTCTFQITQFTPGPVTFAATDSHSGTADAAFTVVSQLTVSPTSGPAGTSVTFTGTGFQAGTAWYVTWQSGLVNACEAITNGYGSFSCAYTIPAAPAAKYVFTSTDPSEHTATTTFSVEPTLTVSPTSGLAGTVLTIYGTSYAASSSVTVGWSGGTACTVTSSATGDFSCSYTVPAYTLGGTYTFTGTDASKNKATVTFTDTASLKVSSASGPVGTKLTFKGTGFADNVSVSVDWSGGEACTSTTSSSGAFSCTFKVPAVAGGSDTFNATDANFNSAKVKFKVTPSLTATPTSGVVGSTAIFSGTGFAGSAKVNVTWSGGTACQSTTSKVGSFSCSFAISPTANGLYTFTGTDAKGNSAVSTYTVEANLIDSPTSGPVGTVVTFNGTGFAGNSAVTVSWSGGTARLTSTNATGNFSCTFTIPTGTGAGSYTFTATDAQSNSAKVAFDVT